MKTKIDDGDDKTGFHGEDIHLTHNGRLPNVNLE